MVSRVPQLQALMANYSMFCLHIFLLLLQFHAFLSFGLHESFYVVYFMHCYFFVLAKRKGIISSHKEASHHRA